jgi:polyhydroxyalkanoate synthase
MVLACVPADIPLVGTARRSMAVTSRWQLSEQWNFSPLPAPSAHDEAMTETPWQVAKRAADVLAPESNALSNPEDVAQLGDALAKVVRQAAVNPMHLANVGLNLAVALAQVPPRTLTQWLSDGDTVPPGLDPKDRRFSDPAWNGNPFFVALRLAHAAACRSVLELIDPPGVDPMTAKKAHMLASLTLDALAPTNFLPTNPAAIKRAFETGGRSLLKGARNFLDDVRTNGGRPRQVDSSPFVFGKNTAATPGKVVYRNDLIELIQYEAQTPQVHAAPLLCSPPWINKYYIMDLAPKRSFIEWAVQHNRTVFAISYRNATAEMSGVKMDDYLLEGPKQALDVITDITGADTVDIVGLCLGGALTAITAAYLASSGDERVGNLTLLNTMLDYSDPGGLALFTDAKSVERLERKMSQSGYLDGVSMSGTFDVLRANDLIFNYVVSNWLLGQSPPAFDILAWNADSTRMPAAMHSFYLRKFYVENSVVLGQLELAGRRIELGDLKHNVYVVSAENDHIVPWRSAYATTQLVAGPARFVLSSGGHIAGIVNPPGPKNWYLAADEVPADPDEWRRCAIQHQGSWWEDWSTWSAAIAGDLVEPPPVGSDSHPAVCDAPGTYIST